MSRLKYCILRLALAGLLISLPRALYAETECVGLFDRLDEIEMLGGQAADDGALDNARAMYEHLGCATVPTDPNCRDLSAQIRNLQASGLGNSGLAKERQQIMARLRSLGCMSGQGRQDWDKATEGAKDPELFEDLYREGGRQDIWRSPGDDNYGETVIADGGRYRTLCVRSCDGYYWPMSFSTTSGSFQRDEKMCTASCPGQQVGLYVHRNPGETADQAKTPGGEPYAALANAFLYRKRYVPACSCATQPQPQPQDIKVIGGPEGEAPAEKPALEKPGQGPVPHNPAPQQQDSEDDDADVYRTAPVIVGPENGGEKTTPPNGLRGVSP